MVLLGQRQSIASVLRGCLMPRRSNTDKTSRVATSYDGVVRMFGKRPSHKSGKYTGLFASTACYLCFSNGTETTVVEKDRVTAKVRSRTDFIVITNSDEQPENNNTDAQANAAADGKSSFSAALAEIVDEAIDRKQCAEHNWHNMKVARAAHFPTATPAQSTRSMDVEDVITMVQKYPTTNEMTHFACVMDPKEGNVVWCQRWVRPITAKWIREHQSSTW